MNYEKTEKVTEETKEITEENHPELKAPVLSEEKPSRRSKQEEAIKGLHLDKKLLGAGSSVLKTRSISLWIPEMLHLKDTPT